MRRTDPLLTLTVLNMQRWAVRICLAVTDEGSNL